MKKLLFILTIVSIGFRPVTDGENMRVLAVSKESKIAILGSSNVNTFSLEVKHYKGDDTLVLIQKEKQQLVSFKEGVLRVPVSDFKNGNPVLTSDFRKVVKAKQFPEMLMIFRNITVFPGSGNQSLEGEAEVVICVAGQSKITKVNINTCRAGENVYLNGSANFCFSDFGLTPPENVMGFINVKDDLKVNFSLALKDITGKTAMK